MNDELKAFEQEMKRDRKEALKLAKAYVKEHRGEFAPLEGLSIETCVEMVSQYRAAGRLEEAMLADMWVQAEFGPQTIVGSMRIGG